MIVASMPPKPLILMGTGWRSMMESFYNSFEAYIPQNQRVLISFATNIQEAVRLLPNHQ
jgi:hypothetical protein